MTDRGKMAMGKARGAFALYRHARSPATGDVYLDLWFDACEIALEEHRKLEQASGRA